MLEAGRIGTPLQVDADFGFRVPVDPHHRLFDPLQGGGALLDLGIYPLQLCTLVLGPIERASAAGVLGETGVDEQVAAVLRHERGGIGVVKAAVTVAARVHGPHQRHRRLDRPARRSCTARPRSPCTPSAPRPRSIDAPIDVDGLEHEIREVHRCLAEGLTESPGMPLSETLALATGDGRHPRPDRRRLPGGAVMARRTDLAPPARQGHRPRSSGCRRRRPATPSPATSGSRPATASTCSPTCTSRPARRPGRSSCARRTAGRRRSPPSWAACSRAAATACVLARCRGTFGSGGDVRADASTRSTTAPTPSPGCASSRGSTAGSPPTAPRTWGSRSGRCSWTRRRSS